MKDVINNKAVHCFYYPVVLFSYFMALFLPSIVRPGVVSAIFICVVIIEVLAAGTRDDRVGLHNIFEKAATEDIIMALWLLFNVLSGIWCVLGSGMPPSVYLGELFTTALPMMFYYCGRNDIRSCPGPEGGKVFDRLFLVSVAVTGIVGIILFAAGPQFYVNYLKELALISKADVPTMRVRMHSVIGSTLMGFLPSVGMLVSVRCFLDSGESRGRRLSVLSFFLMLFLAFMSNQRSAMAAAIIVIIYLNILVFFVYRAAPVKFFIAEVGAFVAGTIGFFLIFNGAFMKVYYRLVSLPGAIAQRSDQWVGAANNMISIWFGNGLGANGHRAIGYTEHLIADGGIAKLYVESGIAGSSLFVFLILLLLGKASKNLIATAPETGIVLIVLLMSIGSNMMSFALSVPVFYYYMGSLSVRANPPKGAGN